MSVQDFEKMFLGKISVSKGHLGKIPTDLFAMSAYKISIRSSKISVQDLCKDLYQSFVAKISEISTSRGPHFARTCAIRMYTLTSQKSRLVHARVFNENAADQRRDNPAALILCKVAQSKCTAICHKGHF